MDHPQAEVYSLIPLGDGVILITKADHMDVATTQRE